MKLGLADSISRWHIRNHERPWAQGLPAIPEVGLSRCCFQLVWSENSDRPTNAHCTLVARNQIIWPALDWLMCESGLRSEGRINPAARSVELLHASIIPYERAGLRSDPSPTWATELYQIGLSPPGGGVGGEPGAAASLLLLPRSCRPACAYNQLRHTFGRLGHGLDEGLS